MVIPGAAQQATCVYTGEVTDPTRQLATAAAAAASWNQTRYHNLQLSAGLRTTSARAISSCILCCPSILQVISIYTCERHIPNTPAGYCCLHLKYQGNNCAGRPMLAGHPYLHSALLHRLANHLYPHW